MAIKHAFVSSLSDGNDSTLVKPSDWNAAHIGEFPAQSATFVVAASNANSKVKEYADYICDGVDDQVQIQAAIDALPSTGGSILLSNGQFNISSTILIKSYVTFAGVGPSTILYLSNNSNVDVLSSNPALALDYINIRDLRINGNKDNNSAGSGIYLYNPARLFIDNVAIINPKADGIRLERESNSLNRYGESLIHNSYLANGDGNGISVNLDNDFTIYGLDIISTRVEVFAGYGIKTYGSGKVLIDDCWISSNANGVYINGSSRPSMSSSKIEYNSVFGAQFQSVYYARIIGSLFRDNSYISSGYSNLNFIAGGKNEVIGNHLFDDRGGSAKVDYNIEETSTASSNIYMGNLMYGATVANMLIVDPASALVRANMGYVTENSGTATITAGQTSVNVTHNLAATPTRVQLTPTTDTGGKRYWISAKGASTFTITIDSTYTSDIIFDWRAIVGEGN